MSVNTNKDNQIERTTASLNLVLSGEKGKTDFTEMSLFTESLPEGSHSPSFRTNTFIELGPATDLGVSRQRLDRAKSRPSNISEIALFMTKVDLSFDKITPHERQAISRAVRRLIVQK